MKRYCIGLVALCMCILMTFSTTTATTTAAATIPGLDLGPDDMVISATTKSATTTAIGQTFDLVKTTIQTPALKCTKRPAAQSQFHTGTNFAVAARRSVLKMPFCSVSNDFQNTFSKTLYPSRLDALINENRLTADLTPRRCVLKFIHFNA